MCIIYQFAIAILGKDQLIFVTAEDHATPSKVILSEDEDEYEGLIKPSGEINWDCPCLQGMADGPCGEEFKAAFSCFHYSEAEVKGSDCVPQFRDMQVCFSKYPEIYGKDKDDESDSERSEKGANDEGGDVTESLNNNHSSNSQEIQLSNLAENGTSSSSIEETSQPQTTELKKSQS